MYVVHVTPPAARAAARGGGQAIAAAHGMIAESPFAFWKQLYDRLMVPPRFPALLQHFGISLVERAMLDAV